MIVEKEKEINSKITFLKDKEYNIEIENKNKKNEFNDEIKENKDLLKNMEIINDANINKELLYNKKIMK